MTYQDIKNNDESFPLIRITVQLWITLKYSLNEWFYVEKQRKNLVCSLN